MPQAILIIELLLKYGPAAAKAARTILQTEEPTEAQWESLWKTTKEPFDVPDIPER